MDQQKDQQAYERVEIAPGIWADMPQGKRTPTDSAPDFEAPLDFENTITRRDGA